MWSVWYAITTGPCGAVLTMRWQWCAWEMYVYFSMSKVHYPIIRSAKTSQRGASQDLSRLKMIVLKQTSTDSLCHFKVKSTDMFEAFLFSKHVHIYMRLMLLCPLCSWPGHTATLRRMSVGSALLSIWTKKGP